MKFRSKTFLSFVVLALVYASVNLLAAPPRTSLQRYHVSSSSLRLLNSTVVLPIVAIWFVALYGYQKLRTYTNHIQDTKEGKQVIHLTRGVMFLTLWLPVSSTISAVLNLIARSHHSLLPLVIIIVNYLTLLFPIVAFLYISRGAHELSALAKQHPDRRKVNVLAMVVIGAGVFYGYLVSNIHNASYTIYHLPVAVVLLTLAIPYIYAWHLGLLAAYELHLYTKKVTGLIYRKSWNALALGIVWIILFSILLQYLTTVSAKLNHLSLGWILALIYTIIPVMAVGYVFVAIGAKKLTKIEEV